MPETGQSSHVSEEEWGLLASTFVLVISLTYPTGTHPSKPGRTAARNP